jgi:ribose 5-phosphate isomerase B
MSAIFIGSDHAGFDLKEKIKGYLVKRGYSVQDVGTHSTESCHYPEYAYAVAEAVSRKKASRGILICKTGIGNSIVANRVPGVRASLCYNVAAAKLTRQHNDSNILVLGSGFVSAALAKRIVQAWLDTEFEGGRHQLRLDMLKKIEKDIRDHETS